MKMFCLSLVVGVLCLVAGCGCGKSGGEKVYIQLENAENLGSLQMTLSYDDSIIEIIDIKAEKLSKNAMLEFNKDTPGRLVIGIIDSAGINGSGPVAVINFKILQEDGDSPFNIVEAQAYKADTLVDITASIINGSFSKDNASDPTLSFK